MIKEVGTYAEEDRGKRERIVAVNSAADLIYALEKVLQEKRGKIPPNIRKGVKKKIKELRALLETASAEELRRKIANLSAFLWAEVPDGPPQIKLD